MATQDNLRCARCCMVVLDVFSVMMQELLRHRGLSARTIYEIVMNDVPFRNTLRAIDIDRLRSLRTNDDFSKLDTSIIYKIVIYFKKKQLIPEPTTSWGIRPLPTDTDIGDDVERIHFARNDFAHKTNSATSEQEFEDFFSIFYDVGQRVDIYLQNNFHFGHARRILDLKTTTLDTETAEKWLEDRQELEQLKRELVIKENEKEVEIFIGISVTDAIKKLTELRDSSATSTCRLKLTVEGVVDSEEHVQRLKILVDEINAVSHIKVISVERQCIEFIVDINNMYLKDKCLLLEEVTVFYTTLKEKKAFKWKGNTVTIIITIDEDFKEKKLLEQKQVNAPLIVEDSRNFEFEEHPVGKNLVLNLEMKSKDLRDGKLNHQLSTFVENLLSKSNGSDLFEKNHANASLVVEENWNRTETLDEECQPENKGLRLRAYDTVSGETSIRMETKGEGNETTGILALMDRLEKLAKPVINDRRQKKYCKYISLFLSHFGQERCMVAGSTNENTRLRLKGDEGDFDYLIISGKSIPIECLEYRKNLPCFVYINGSTLASLFPGVELIDGKYLPSDLLSEMKPEAFKHSRNIHKIVTQMDLTHGRNTLHVSIDHKIKPGLSLVHYSNPKCPELKMEQNKQKKDTIQIKQNIKKNLQGDSDELKKMICSGAKAFGSFVGGWEELNKSRDTKKTIMHQTYDPLIKAINCEDTLHQASLSNPKKPKLESCNDLSTYNDVPSTSGVSGKLNDESQREEHAPVNDVDDQVTIQYSYKTSKDFIPVFPLKGKPEYLDNWQNRKRNWPPTDVVTDIYNSEFFVVAKPALVEPSKDIDFCLACNIGEIKLAKAMTQLQRNVILIIKALQKSALRDYTEVLTTFHWKTAVYWVSENTETQILEHRTEDNVLKFLRNVLDYMVNCLCKNDLQHYFVPSNLFVGIHKDDIHKIVPKIVEIKKKPLENLKNFDKEQSTDKVHFDIVSRSKIREFQEMHSDPGDNVVVESVVSLIRGFVIENREVMRGALKDVLTEAVPFLIEETRGHEPNGKDSNSQIIQALSSTDSMKNTVIDVAVSWLLDEMYSTKAPNVEDCKRNMFVKVMQKLSTRNLF